MGRRKLEATGVLGLRVPLSVLAHIYDQDVPRKRLALAVCQEVVESSTDRRWLAERIAETEDMLKLFRQRDRELAEIEEREEMLKAVAPVVELMVEENGASWVKVVAEAGNNATLDRFLKMPKAEALMSEMKLDGVPRAKLCALLVQGVNRHAAANRPLFRR